MRLLGPDGRSLADGAPRTITSALAQLGGPAPHLVGGDEEGARMTGSDRYLRKRLKT